MRRKKWLAFLLILNCVLLTCISHASMEVKAATFKPRLSAPSSSDKYWMHTSAGGLNECIKVDVSTPKLGAIACWAYGTGLISGSKTVVNGAAAYHLNPAGTATRAQMASILQNFCKNNNL